MAPQRGAIFFIRARIKWRIRDVYPGQPGQGRAICVFDGVVMLQTIRDRLSGWVAFLLLGLIAVALVISFGNMSTDVSSLNSAATVNGEDISMPRFQEIYQNELLRQQSRANYPRSCSSRFEPMSWKAWCRIAWYLNMRGNAAIAWTIIA
jgi:hypothetical protein